MNTIEDKFIGTLVGVAVGDALGGPAEELPKRPRESKMPITEMIGGGYHKLKPYQVTDDTEMTLCLARSIVEKKEFDGQDCAQKFLAWFDDNSIGTGKTTREAMENIRNSVPWYDAGKTESGFKRTGNGSVMRCSPIALLNCYNPKKLYLESYQQSMITHPHPDCTHSAIFLNVLIASMINSSRGIAPPNHHDYYFALNSIKHETSLHKHYEKIPTAKPNKPTGNVRETVEASVHCFLTTNSFEEALVKAVNLGGDSDTTGAVTGAIAGAYYGNTAIPARWKEKLIDRHEKPIYEELVKLGKEIYNIATKDL